MGCLSPRRRSSRASAPQPNERDREAFWSIILGMMTVAGVATQPTALDVAAVQVALSAEGLDGWLLYDFRGINPIALDVTGVGRQGGHLATRRMVLTHSQLPGEPGDWSTRLNRAR